MSEDGLCLLIVRVHAIIFLSIPYNIIPLILDWKIGSKCRDEKKWAQIKMREISTNFA